MIAALVDLETHPIDDVDYAEGCGTELAASGALAIVLFATGASAVVAGRRRQR